MKESLGDILFGLDAALAGFRAQLAPFPALSDAAFQDAADWTRLLTYKLLPHLAGEGCLVAAVAGGTNTGKSTVFNLLLSEDISPVRTTAAATCRPLLAGNPKRAGQCLSGKLVPEFAPEPLTDRESVVSGAATANAMFVVQRDILPDWLVLLDIPDVDSIDRQNWEVAENIQAAGDVLIAVLTGEKYKDERVVGFFRKANAAGRMILPLMNKANPKNNYEVARAQIKDFSQQVGVEHRDAFVLPHDFDLAADFKRPVFSLDGGPDLFAYLSGLEVSRIKERVYSDTVAHFALEAEDFVARNAATGERISSIVEEFSARARASSEQYDPEPGEKVGKLLHEFIRTRRGIVSRTVGTVGNTVGRILSPVGRIVGAALLDRARLEGPEARRTHTEVLEHRRQEVEVLARNLLRDYLQTARNLWEPAASLVLKELEAISAEEAVSRVVAASVEEQQISEAFRDHAKKTIETWWAENRIRRQVLLELDTLLVLAPTAVAVPLAVYTSGVGIPEVMAAAGPLAGTFFARVMEHQFAEKWFDLIAPWRREQQARLERALAEHITEPALRGVAKALEAFSGEHFSALQEKVAQLRRVAGKD